MTTEEKLQHEIDGLRALAGSLAAALTSLTVKLDAVGADPGYQGMFTLAWTHGMEYKGPNCGEELESAKSVLTQTTSDLARQWAEGREAVEMLDWLRMNELDFGAFCERHLLALQTSRKLGTTDEWLFALRQAMKAGKP